MYREEQSEIDVTAGFYVLFGSISLSVLLLGVGVATVTDLQLNAVGSILSLLAIITTCIAQIVSFDDSFCLFLHKLKFPGIFFLSESGICIWFQNEEFALDVMTVHYYYVSFMYYYHFCRVVL